MRLLTLTLAWAWCVTASSLGLYSLIKSNEEKAQLKAEAPHGVVVNIDTNDVLIPGIVATAAFTLVGLVASLCAFPAILGTIRGTPRKSSRRALRTEAVILAFCVVWMIASLIPYTLIFATRSARVTAFIGSLQLPPKVVQQQEQALHASPVYRDKSYLRIFGIVSWIATFVTAVAASASFASSSAVERTDSFQLDQKAGNGHRESPDSGDKA